MRSNRKIFFHDTPARWNSFTAWLSKRGFRSLGGFGGNPRFLAGFRTEPWRRRRDPASACNGKLSGDRQLTTGTDRDFTGCPDGCSDLTRFPPTEPVAFLSSIWHRRGGRQEPLPVRMRV